VPVQEQNVVGQFGHQLRVVQQDVSPDLDASPVARSQFAQPQNMLQVDAPDADLGCQARRAPLPQVPGLVAAHVEPGRAEGGQHIAIHVVEQAVRVLVRHVERPADVRLGEPLVLRDAQDVVHVPEGLQVGLQFHLPFPGVGVQCQDVVPGEGPAPRPD